jgi:hypothetical protein
MFLANNHLTNWNLSNLKGGNVYIICVQDVGITFLLVILIHAYLTDM